MAQTDTNVKSIERGLLAEIKTGPDSQNKTGQQETDGDIASAAAALRLRLGAQKKGLPNLSDWKTS